MHAVAKEVNRAIKGEKEKVVSTKSSPAKEEPDAARKALLEGILKEEATHKHEAGDCVFCDIRKGVVAAYIVFEDTYSLAFLDNKPLFKGHTILIPKEHYETLHDVPNNVLSVLFNNARIVSEGIEKALGSDGTFIAVNNKVSQSVPHFHIHIIPRKHGDGLKGFFWPRQKYESENEEKEMQKAIADAIVAILERDRD